MALAKLNADQARLIVRRPFGVSQQPKPRAK
jgi:hypothetical protein